MENEKLLDVKEVAMIIKVSAATIRKWVFIGYIPYKKIGRAIRFSAAEIQGWTNSKSVSPVYAASATSVQLQLQENEGGGK